MHCLLRVYHLLIYVLSATLECAHTGAGLGLLSTAVSSAGRGVWQTVGSPSMKGFMNEYLFHFNFSILEFISLTHKFT